MSEKYLQRRLDIRNREYDRIAKELELLRSDFEEYKKDSMVTLGDLLASFSIGVPIAFIIVFTMMFIAGL